MLKENEEIEALARNPYNAEIIAYGMRAIVPAWYLIKQGMCEFKTAIEVYGYVTEQNTMNLLRRVKNESGNYDTANQLEGNVNWCI